MFKNVISHAWHAYGIASLVVILGAVIVTLLLSGRATRSLLRREFGAYFFSPVAYVALTVFLLVTGYLFTLTQDQLAQVGPRGVEYPMRAMLGDVKFWLVFLFIVPMLTMRLLAEERGSGTLETLLTAPIRDWQVVLAKFAACFGFYLLMWIPTLCYLPVLLDLHQTHDLHHAWTPYSIAFVGGIGLMLLMALWSILAGPSWSSCVIFVIGLVATIIGGYLHYHLDDKHVLDVTAGIDPHPACTSYLGVILAGGMFLSIGLYVSSLLRSAIVAGMVTAAISLIFILPGFWQPDLDHNGTPYKLLYFFSVPMHFNDDFSRGIIDTRHLVLYVSVTLCCLFLTVRSVESRRWK